MGLFSFIDYLFSGPRVGVHGMLYTYKGRSDDGRKELERLAKETYVKVTIADAASAGEGVAIRWSAKGSAEDIANFKRLMALSTCFEKVTFTH